MGLFHELYVMMLKYLTNATSPETVLPLSSLYNSVMWQMCMHSNNFPACYTDVINTISLRLRYESSENCNNGLLDRNSVEYATLRADVIQEVYM